MSIILWEKKSNDKKIIFTGGIYNTEILNMLRQNCFGYLHGHSVGGTNPSLIEAMVMKNLLLAHDNQFNREVCGDTALYFHNSDDLRHQINQIENDPENYLELKIKAFDRVKKEYSWDKIVGQYHQLFKANLMEKNHESTSRNVHGNHPSWRNQ